MLLLLYIQNNPLEEEVQVKNVTLFAKMNYFILNSRALVESFYYNLELYIAFKMRFIDDRFFVPNELKNHNLCYWHALNFKTVNGVLQANIHTYNTPSFNVNCNNPIHSLI